jgi:hypothetical protein
MFGDKRVGTIATLLFNLISWYSFLLFSPGSSFDSILEKGNKKFASYKKHKK